MNEWKLGSVSSQEGGIKGTDEIKGANQQAGY